MEELKFFLFGLGLCLGLIVISLIFGFIGMITKSYLNYKPESDEIRDNKIKKIIK